MNDYLGMLQYYAAPVAAPIPTAIAVGQSLHQSLLSIDTMPEMALAGAVCGAVAIEFGGGMMFSNAGQAFADGKRGALVASVAGAVMYAGIVSYSLWAGAESRPMIGAVLVTFVVYLAKAIRDYLMRVDTVTNQGHAQTIETMTAQRLLNNSEARKAKTTTPAPANIGNNSENIGKLPETSEPKKTRWNEVKPDEYAWIAQASTAEIVTKYGIDERSARNWRKSAERNRDQ